MGNSLEQHRASIGAFNASSKRRRRIFVSRSSNLVPIAAPIHLQLQQKQFSSNLMAQPMKELSNRDLQIQQWEENAKTDSEAGFRKQAKLVDNILEHTSRQVNQSKIVSENNWQEWACICNSLVNEVCCIRMNEMFIWIVSDFPLKEFFFQRPSPICHYHPRCFRSGSNAVNVILHKDEKTFRPVVLGLSF